SDFVGRPRLDAEELDRERGVVIQEINRAYDQPSTVAEYLIDRAAFGEHPLGRTVLGPEENLRSFMREGIVAFRERRWAGARGGRAQARGAVDLRDLARRLDGLAAVRGDTREARAVLLDLRRRSRLRRRADPAARVGARVEQDDRGLHAHARDRR